MDWMQILQTSLKEEKRGLYSLSSYTSSRISEVSSQHEINGLAFCREATTIHCLSLPMWNQAIAKSLRKRRSIDMPKSGCSSNQKKDKKILVLVSDRPFDGECRQISFKEPLIPQRLCRSSTSRYSIKRVKRTVSKRKIGWELTLLLLR